MFKVGDKVEVSNSFEGSITVSGWDRNDIDGYVFEVASRKEFHIKHPNFAKFIKDHPTKGEIFLKHKDVIFALRPFSSLSIVEERRVCECPINRLWAGIGHLDSCPEN